MSEFPISFEKISYTHKGGTKEYHLLWACNDQNQAIIVRRYGKVGKAVNITVDMGNNHAMKALWMKHQAERTGRGYVEQGSSTILTADTLDRAIGVFGRVTWSKLGGKAIGHLFPSVDVSNVPDADGPEYDEEGKKIERKSKSAELAEQLAAEQRALEEAASLQALQSNPMFGRF